MDRVENLNEAEAINLIGSEPELISLAKVRHLDDLGGEMSSSFKTFVFREPRQPQIANRWTSRNSGFQF